MLQNNIFIGLVLFIFKQKLFKVCICAACTFKSMSYFIRREECIILEPQSHFLTSGNFSKAFPSNLALISFVVVKVCTRFTVLLTLST